MRTPCNVYFRFGSLIGCAPATRRLIEQLSRIAATNSTVLIEGEAGTGKLLAAQEIVRHGERARRPFVVLDCEDAPAAVERLLFGDDRSVADLPGGSALARANGGTLLLKDVGGLPLTVQARLVRLIETGSLPRLGTRRPVTVDVRIIATTRDDLSHRCAQRRFRSDLYFCLRPLRVRVPPLRERFADLPHLVQALASDAGYPRALHLDEEFIEWLRRRVWHGNLRELRNVLERVRALGVDAVMLELEHPMSLALPR
jgi:DNA-binding NtrC family response regulator